MHSAGSGLYRTAPSSLLVCHHRMTSGTQILWLVNFEIPGFSPCLLSTPTSAVLIIPRTNGSTVRAVRQKRRKGHSQSTEPSISIKPTEGGSWIGQGDRTPSPLPSSQ